MALQIKRSNNGNIKNAGLIDGQLGYTFKDGVLAIGNKSGGNDRDDPVEIGGEKYVNIVNSTSGFLFTEPHGSGEAEENGFVNYVDNSLGALATGIRDNTTAISTINGRVTTLESISGLVTLKTKNLTEEDTFDSVNKPANSSSLEISSLLKDKNVSVSDVPDYENQYAFNQGILAKLNALQKVGKDLGAVYSVDKSENVLGINNIFFNSEFETGTIVYIGVKDASIDKLYIKSKVLITGENTFKVISAGAFAADTTNDDLKAYFIKNGSSEKIEIEVPADAELLTSSVSKSLNDLTECNVGDTVLVLRDETRNNQTWKYIYADENEDDIKGWVPLVRINFEEKLDFNSLYFKVEDKVVSFADTITGPINIQQDIILSEDIDHLKQSLETGLNADFTINDTIIDRSNLYATENQVIDVDTKLTSDLERVYSNLKNRIDGLVDEKGIETINFNGTNHTGSDVILSAIAQFEQIHNIGNGAQLTINGSLTNGIFTFNEFDIDDGSWD